MKRSLGLTLAVFAGTLVLAVLLVGFRLLQGGVIYSAYAHICAPLNFHGGVADFNGDTVNDFHVEIDADTCEGGCFDVDWSASVSPGPHDVAVCSTSAPSSIGAIEFVLNYDPTLESCEDIDCGHGNCIDDNPDLNEAALGEGWDCDIFGLEPTCRRDGIDGKAWLACWSIIGPYVSPTGDVSFPLAYLTLNAVGYGVENLTLSNVIVADGNAVEIGTCNPAVSYGTVCEGAYVYLPSPTASPTLTATPTRTATPLPTPAGVGGKVMPPLPPQSSDSGALSGGSLDVMMLCSVLLGILAAGIGVALHVKRSRRRPSAP